MGTLSAEMEFLQALESKSQQKPNQDEIEDLKVLTEWDTVMKMPVAHWRLLCEALFPAYMLDGSESKELYPSLQTAVKDVLETLNIKCGIVIAGDPVDGLSIQIKSDTESVLHDNEIIDILLVLPEVSVGTTGRYKVKAQSQDEVEFQLVSSDAQDEPLDANSFMEMQNAKKQVDEVVGRLLQGRCKHRVNIAMKFGSLQNSTDQAKEPACHVIPAEDPKKWTYSLHEHTHFLSQQLTTPQRQVFIIIKLLMCMEFDIPSVVTIDHARMIFLNACQSNAKNSISDQTQLLGLFFHQLLSCLLTREVPLPNLPKFHALGSFSEDIVQTILNRLVNIRRSPMTFIVKHYPKTGIHGGIQPEELLNTIEPVVKDSMDLAAENTSQSINNIIVPAAQRLAGQLAANSLDADLSDKKAIIKRAFDLSETCNKIWNAVLAKSGNKYSSKELHVMTAFNSGKPAKAIIDLMEHVFEVYGPSSSDLNNLACMYHTYSCTVPSEDKGEVVQKAKNLFERAFHPNAGDGEAYDSYIDYCTFLCKTNMHEEAMQYLQIEMAKEELKMRHNYGMAELDTVDEHMQQEIGHAPNNSIGVIGPIYSRYLMAQCQLKLNKDADIQQLTGEMVMTVNKILSEYMAVKVLHLNMVGYVFMDAGLFADALQVFQQVMEMQPENVLAQEHHMECQALILSLDS